MNSTPSNGMNKQISKYPKKNEEEIRGFHCLALKKTQEKIRIAGGIILAKIFTPGVRPSSRSWFDFKYLKGKQRILNN